MDFNIGASGRIRGLAKMLSDLSATDVKNAISKFEKANSVAKSFSESIAYDLVYKGKRYPPKAIFGLATSTHLNKQIKSSHFAGGESSTCFKILIDLGFSIVAKRPNKNDGLELYADYTREDVCRIFAPQTKFTGGSGSWGISGIVTPPVERDKVFFVTLEQASDYSYKDVLTQDGVLIWKSQNQQKPTDKQIQDLANHDHTASNVYLFLRANEGESYLYMGLLKHRSWNENSSNPVHFTWTLLQWPAPESVLTSKQLVLQTPLEPTYSNHELVIPELVETPVQPKVRVKKRNSSSKTLPPPNWSDINSQNEQLGAAGELAVLKFEKMTLIAAGRADLADKVEHTAILNGAAGYDIMSFDPETEEPHRIEVKTTKYNSNRPFFISKNEVLQSKNNSNSYWIYRLFNFLPNKEKVDFFKQRGEISEHFDLQSEVYSAILKVI